MKRRLARLAAGVAGVAALMLLAGVGETRNGVPALVLVLIGGVGWTSWGWVQRRRPARADGWAPAAAVAYRPAADRPSGAARAVPLALARVETRELTTSTSFGVAMGFCALAVYLFGFEWVGDRDGYLPSAFELAPILTHPLAGMVVVGAFRARTRGRRDGVEELFESCPAKQSTRTVGHLLTAWAPALTALVYVVLMTALIERGSAAVFGEIGARQVAAVLGAAVLCIGAACLGVALARWAPWSIVPILAVFGVGLLSVRLATHGTRTTEPVRQLSTWLGDPEIDLRLTAPHWVAHHVWILALVAVVGAAAVLRDRRGPAVLGVGTLAVAVAVAAAVTATRPIDGADARRIAALLEDPENQPCVDAGGLAVCTFRADDDLTAALSGAVRPAAAAAAPGALVGWSVRQGASVDWSQLDPEVRSLLGATPAPDPRIIPIEMATDPTSLEGARLWAGLAAAGVLDEWTRGTTLDVRGEARGVVALWLATRGVDDEAQRDMTSVGSGDSTSADSGRPWPDSCDEGAGVVRWAATDVFAAREMLAVPQEDVRAVLLADWEQWTRPDASTDELLEALGLDPVGVEGTTPGAGAC